MISNVNSPTLTSMDCLDLHWQMTRAEKFAFEMLVREVSPGVAIEVGTYHGGSLQILAKHSKHVHSIDISPEPRNLLASKFSNVDFHIGPSVELIEKVVKQIENEGKKLELVLIDGDHSEDGVASDINALLRLRPKHPLTVVFHDSFHPPCRAGILKANWLKCPHVHFVEVDFIPGVFHQNAFDTAPAGSMYGGLAVARLSPDARDFDLEIQCSQQGLFDTVLKASCYAQSSDANAQVRPAAFVSPLHRLRRRVGLFAKNGG